MSNTKQAELLIRQLESLQTSDSRSITVNGYQSITAILSKGIKPLADEHPDLNPYPGKIELLETHAFLGAVKKQPTQQEATARAHAFHGDPRL